MANTETVIAVGIVGFGHLGEYLAERIQREGASAGLQLAFVWNRSKERLREKLTSDLILDDLTEFTQRGADLIVEVGSPSSLSDSTLEGRLRCTAELHGKTLYVPSGALWGGVDIQRLSERGGLKSLLVRMSKHPSCFRLAPPLHHDWSEGEGRHVLFSGPVHDLCPLAPNNVNTMAAAALAAPDLGFSGVTGEIVSDTELSQYHIVEVEVTGHDGFTVTTMRRNPAQLGAVTGSATYQSFWSSILVCKGHGGRVFLC
ncbi:aspartate dehydrogenase domain-containing protein isoform X2 [Amia ocellicauda]|uniref:aspartate dehydrogenase domain-containing protein isoform X2 n=1 Tax=Amia ocellicauda TaxID=2972642 RepID=UPI0034639839